MLQHPVPVKAPKNQKFVERKRRLKKFLLVYHALIFLSFFLTGNIGCTKKTNLGKTLSGSFAKHKSFFPSFFATATTWKIPFSAILPVEPPREKERQRGELIARGELKPRMPLPRVKIHGFRIFFFSAGDAAELTGGVAACLQPTAGHRGAGGCATTRQLGHERWQRLTCRAR